MNVQEKRKMRRWLLPLLLFVPMFFVGGCSSDEDGGYDSSDYMEVELPPLSDEIKERFYVEPWRHWETFKNQKGVIVNRAFEEGFSVLKVHVLYSDPEKIYGFVNPVNMPEEYLLEGVEIVFSGETRDHPTTSFDALPLILTNLKVKKNGVIK